jgi:phage/plasmid-associated DNA primase
MNRAETPPPASEHAAEVFGLLALIAKSELESPITQLFPPCLEELWVSGCPNKSTARKLARAVCLWLKGHWKVADKDYLTKKGFEVIEKLIEWDARNTEPLGEAEINKLVMEVLHGSRTSISCDELKEDLVLGFYCHESDCYYKRAEDQATTRNISLDDVAFFDEDKGRYKFSPDRAADSIINVFEIITTPDKKIWIYNGGIFEPVGDYLIGKILDRVAGDLLTIRALKEALEKVYFRTREEYEVFDADPYLFCVQNGVIDMRRGHAGFEPHNPKYRRTWKAPVVYDPESRMVEGERFLQSALDEDGQRTFLEILAAKTTGLNFEYFSPWIGRGQNGKTKAEEWIRAFWGDGQVTEAEVSTLGKRRFDLWELKGKSFLINSEVEGGRSEIRWIKHISGGGKVTADRKHTDHVSFRPHCFIIYDCNRPPRFDDNTHAFNRRITPILWPYSFVDEPKELYEKLKDPDVLEKITRPEELSGLLNTLIEIAPQVIETRTIHRVASGEKIATAYDMKAASGDIFWDKFVEEDPGMTVSTAWLYSKYKEFCDIVGASAILDRSFNDIGRKLKYRKGRERTPAGRIQVWQNCDFNQDSWNEFILEWTSIGPALDQPKSTAGPAGPSGPSNSINSIKETEDIEGPEILYNKVHDLPGPAGPAGPASVSAGPLDQVGAGPSTISENLAEGTRREAEHLEHFKTPEPVHQKTYLALVDVPTFSDGNGRTWTLKKNDIVSGLPDLLVKPLIKKEVLKEVIE